MEYWVPIGLSYYRKYPFSISGGFRRFYLVLDIISIFYSKVYSYNPMTYCCVVGSLQKTFYFLFATDKGHVWVQTMVYVMLKHRKVPWSATVTSPHLTSHTITITIVAMTTSWLSLKLVLPNSNNLGFSVPLLTIPCDELGLMWNERKCIQRSGSGYPLPIMTGHSNNGPNAWALNPPSCYVKPCWWTTNNRMEWIHGPTRNLSWWCYNTIQLWMLEN